MRQGGGVCVLLGTCQGRQGGKQGVVCLMNEFQSEEVGVYCTYTCFIVL